eukprot:2623305-Rhodomonas_salina.1
MQTRLAVSAQLLLFLRARNLKQHLWRKHSSCLIRSRVVSFLRSPVHWFEFRWSGFLRCVPVVAGQGGQGVGEQPVNPAHPPSQAIQVRICC